MTVVALAAIVALIIVGLIQFQQTLASIYVHLGLASLEGIMGIPLPRGLWFVVFLNVLFVSAFLFLIPLRIRQSWRSHGAYVGFMVSLFSEMFGFPLTVFFLTGLGYGLFEPQFIGYVFAYGQLIGSPLVVVGLILVIKGWSAISFHKDDVLVTGGIYKVVRHPQYLGLLLITLGHFIVWPTIPTAIMWPILVGLYYSQAKREDLSLLEKFGEKFRGYAQRTPMFLPRRRGQPRRGQPSL